MSRTNPHNSPGLTTSFTPPVPAPAPAPAPAAVFNPVFGDPGVLIVDNRLVEFIVGVPVGVRLSLALLNDMIVGSIGRR